MKTVYEEIPVKNKLGGIRCTDKTSGKTVYAYHVDELGIAYNKYKTLCIGCIGADLFPVYIKK